MTHRRHEVADPPVDVIVLLPSWHPADAQTPPNGLLSRTPTSRTHTAAAEAPKHKYADARRTNRTFAIELMRRSEEKAPAPAVPRNRGRRVVRRDVPDQQPARTSNAAKFHWWSLGAVVPTYVAAPVAAALTFSTQYVSAGAIHCLYIASPVATAREAEPSQSLPTPQTDEPATVEESVAPAAPEEPLAPTALPTPA